MNIQVNVREQINRPLAEVFDAVVDHEKMQRYFITASSGPLRQGETVQWRWGDITSDTTVLELIENALIVCQWEAYKVDYPTTCRFEFTDNGDGSTTICVNESGWKGDQAGLESALEHTAGWQHMVLCLKAWMEHGIDLRGTTFTVTQ